MKRIKLLILLMLMAVLVCACSEATDTAAAAVQPTAQAHSGLLTVRYLDIGQGDSILITSPDGKNMLIDAGEDGDHNGSVLNYLKAYNISSLDTVVATHPHSDHINAMDDVLKNITVTNFYLPNAVHTTKDYENMIDCLENVPNTVQAKAGISFKLGSSVSCDILAPVSDEYKDLNNYSAVIKMTYGNTSFLFTGDAEALSEKEIIGTGVNIEADVLKCGHHGSSSSTSSDFLNKVNPKLAVISCGKDNDYGHPHKETMQKLSSKGITVLRTDLMGTITLQSDGSTVTQSGEAVTEATTSAANTANTDTVTTYIGNKNSKKFHLPTCSGLPSEKNRVYFTTKQEAEQSGYTACGICKP